MQAINLTKTLKSYNTGWVAIDKKQKVVAWSKTFNTLNKKIKRAEDVFLMPASNNYSGFLTHSHA